MTIPPRTVRERKLLEGKVPGILITGTRVDSTSYSAASQTIMNWSSSRESRYVCVANVHVLMEAHDSAEMASAVHGSDLTVSDGMPLVWMLRLKGSRNQERVYGPTLMLHVLKAAEREGVPVGFFGGSPEVLQQLVKRIEDRYSGIRIAFVHSPPFHALSSQEDAEIVQKINESGVGVLFVGLGCPKQERWMAEHRGKVQAVMIGVGAAFDFHAGAKPQAPNWMQKIGLEWLFRLITEPRRLWKRYLYYNPRFVLLAIRDLISSRSNKPKIDQRSEPVE